MMCSTRASCGWSTRSSVSERDRRQELGRGQLMHEARVSGLGLYHSAVQLAFGVSYAVGPWLASIFTLQPDSGLVAGAPIVVKVPLTLNFIYVARPYISVRSYVGLKR